MKSIGPILLAAVLYFACGALSHIVLPFHRNAIHELENSESLRGRIAAAAPESGTYILPYMDPDADEETQKALDEKWVKGPIVFASVSHDGGRNRGEALGIQAAQVMIATLMLAFILKLGGARSFVARYGTILAASIFFYVLGPVAQWNWWRFSDATTFAYLLEIVGGWAVAGIPLAAMGRGGKA